MLKNKVKKQNRVGAICLVLSLLLCISSNAVAATPETERQEVELIYESVSTDNSLYSTLAESLQWNVDGGRESNAREHEERVWGWSTCKDGVGTNVYHYTVSRYETWAGTPHVSSGRVWGTGKVWAYSPWIDQDDAFVLAARVYYGL